MNLVPKKSDDSHANLAWETARAAILGRFFELGNQKMRLVYLPEDKELKFENDQADLISSIELEYADHETLLMWWKMQLQELGFQGDLIEQVQYDLPDTSAYQTTEIQETAEYVEIWQVLRTQANLVFEYLNAHKKIKSSIRIWPHHFDTGVYYSMHQNSAGEETQSIGAGLAIADNVQHEPYYYMYGWSKEQEIDFSNAPDLGAGKWLTGDWKGAILPISAIENLIQTSQVNEFYDNAFDFLKASLHQLVIK